MKQGRLMFFVALTMILAASSVTVSSHYAGATDVAGTGSSYCGTAEGGGYPLHSKGGVQMQWNNVYACGPMPYLDTRNDSGPPIPVFWPTTNLGGFQCTEFAVRYVYAMTQGADLFVPSSHWDGYGGTFAASAGSYYNWSVGQHMNGTASSSLPSVGDVISEWGASGPRSPYQHVAVVVAVTATTITTLGENETRDGIGIISIHSATSWSVNSGSYYYTNFQWVHVPVTSTPPQPTGHPMVNRAHTLCLDAAAQTLANNGGTVQLWQCVGDSNQQWYAVGNELRNQANGKCLDANWGTDGNNGGKVMMWSCNNGPNQQWVAHGNMFVNQAHNLCLDANWGTDGNNGGLVQLWSCNNGVNQQWGASVPTPRSPKPTTSASCGENQLSSAVNSFVSKTTQYTSSEYKIVSIKTAGSHPTWDSFGLVATANGQTVFQDATGVASCDNGWKVVALGGLWVGCHEVPTSLHAALGVSCPPAATKAPTPGYATPEDAVAGLFEGLISHDSYVACMYALPSDRASCDATYGMFTLSGAIHFHGDFRDGTRALVRLTGTFCISGFGCTTSTDPNIGLPNANASFDAAFIAAINSGNVSPVPCQELNGRWYVAGTGSGLSSG